MGLFSWLKTESGIESHRQDFPILNQTINGKPLVYLDNGATSLTPNQVLDAIIKYYKEYNANVHRGVHKLSEKATQQYELARKKIAEYIDADFKEIIFTSGTTESLNLLAYSLTKHLRRGDEIVISQMEHHSNLVPWQQLSEERGLKLKFIRVDNSGKLDMEHAREQITEKTKIVSVVHVSNVLGTINDIKTLAQFAHEKGAFMIVDGAQAAPHIPISMTELDCDFYTFSGHKMLGPTGIGVLYGKKEVLEEMSPFMYGGEMIRDVTFYRAKWNEVPWKFEAGTPKIAQAIGLGAAIDYINKITISKIESQIKETTQYAFDKLKEIPGVELYGPKQPESGIVPFNIAGVHPHDVLSILDSNGIAIRGGQMCAAPLVVEVLGVKALCRASLHFYNTKSDIDRLVEAVKKVQEIFAQPTGGQ
ncbi:aminotransferase class V-fold PLP-dependent enzyme [Nanoarchaeota archaeon]